MKPSQLTAYLTATDAQRRPVLVTGQPGIGKSDIVAETMAKVGRRLIITHPVTADPTDFKGLPFASPSSDSARFLPFGDLREMIDATVPTCVFIDDMGQAPPLVQAALMQLVLARRIDGRRVSDHVRFIAATNRRTDGAAVSRILEPLKSRFTIVGLEIDVRDWQVWAGAHGVPVEVIAFAQWRPELITKFQPSPEMQNSPSPRTLAAAASQVALGLPADLELEAIAGDIGSGAATELVAFLRLFRTLPNPQACILNPDTAAIPDANDARFALSGALARMATDSNIGSIMRYLARMPVEFNIFTVTTAIRFKPEIQSTRAFIEWCATHGDVLN